MELTNQIRLKIPLIISSVVVVPAALIYGFNPELLLEISLETADEHNFAKGVMGLYLAFTILWCFGLFNKNYLKPALLSNSLFMLGLAFGRMVSIMNDGLPTIPYIIGMIGELILGLYSAYILNSKDAQDLN